MRATGLRVLPCAVILFLMAAGCSLPGDAPEFGSFPTRPVDLAIADVRGCEVLTPAQESVLRIDDREQEAPEGAGTGDCIFTAGDESYHVQISPRTSAMSFIPGAPNYQGDQLGFVDPRVVTVDGYGAVEAGQGFNYSNYRCDLGIDVGPNQSITVGYENTSEVARSRTVGSREEGCARASRFASMVLATVKARQPR